MLRLSLFAVLMFLFEGLMGQAFWSEDFGTDICDVSETIPEFTSVNGVWTITATGTTDPQGHLWYVSAEEAGMGEGACGDGCGMDVALTNKTLHISSEPVGDNGAAYFETGGGFTDSDTRVETPVINCSGQEDIVLDFLYMVGDEAGDECILQYFDGATWIDLQTLAPTPLDCAPQGQWAAFSTNLPASANNNPNVKIGFRWINIDEIGGPTESKLSVAIDDMNLTSAGAVADITAGFEASLTEICEGDCIDFTDLSTGDGINTWNWTFDGADTGNSSDQNPVGICYSTAGQFAVTLEVISPDGTDELTLTDYITVQECAAPPVADFTSNTQNICEGDCVDFSDLSLGDDITDWSWTFESADTPGSTDQNPAGICYATAGSYDVTLSVTNAQGTDEITLTDFIVVNDCNVPVPDFTSNLQNICVGDCVDFTDLSLGDDITGWEWTFAGADTPNSTDQNPVGICYSTVGTYDVTLSVTNDQGTDEVTLPGFIVVDACTGPTAAFSASDTVICEGECINFTDESTGGATSYSWTFDGADTPVSADPNPTGICYSTAGVYEVSLLVSDGTEDDELIVPAYITVEECAAGPAPELIIGASNTTICLGDCVDFEDLSGDNSIESWLWNFEGGDPLSAVNKNPLQICYSTEGSFDVTLEVTIGGETFDSTFTNFITVVDSCGPVASFDYTPIVCLGQCYSFENTSTGVNPNTSYFWTFEGALPDTSEDENPAEVCYLDATGVYNVTLTVMNEFGSSHSVTQQITVVNPPVVNAGPDQTITQGTTTVVSATGGNGTGQFIWQPFEDVTCFNCPSTNTVPLQETTHFIIFYEQSGGCQGSDTVTVFVNDVVYAADVPTSFSPNGDGLNDILYVRGNNITKLNFIVYNRYGQEVFETSSTREVDGWDGTMNGRQLNAGVFGYYLEAQFSDGTTSIKKGDITLVR